MPEWLLAAAGLALAAPVCLWRSRCARRRLEARAQALQQTYRARYPQRWQALPPTLARGAWPELALERLLKDLPDERRAVHAALAPLRRPLHGWLLLTVVSVGALAVLLWRVLYPA